MYVVALILLFERPILGLLSLLFSRLRGFNRHILETPPFGTSGFRKGFSLSHWYCNLTLKPHLLLSGSRDIFSWPHPFLSRPHLVPVSEPRRNFPGHRRQCSLLVDTKLKFILELFWLVSESGSLIFSIDAMASKRRKSLLS